MQTVYIDVLIILNVYVNYFLLRITAKFTRSPVKTLRCIAASFYGSIYSLLILAPPIPLFVNLAIKFAAAFTVVIAAFGIHGVDRLLKNTAAFFSANFILAGGIYAVYSWLKPQFIHFSNSYFYIDFSLVILVVSTASLYGAVCIFRRFTDKSSDDGPFKLIIRTHGKIFTLNAAADSGNFLTDLFSGLPVIICGKKDLDSDFENISAGDLRTGFRLIPFSTVSNSDVMPVFRPDEAIIVNTANGNKKSVDVMIGLGENNGRAVFNPKLLNI